MNDGRSGMTRARAGRLVVPMATGDSTQEEAKLPLATERSSRHTGSPRSSSCATAAADQEWQPRTIPVRTSSRRRSSCPGLVATTTAGGPADGRDRRIGAAIDPMVIGESECSFIGCQCTTMRADAHDTASNCGFRRQSGPTAAATRSRPSIRAPCGDPVDRARAARTDRGRWRCQIELIARRRVSCVQSRSSQTRSRYSMPSIRVPDGRSFSGVKASRSIDAMRNPCCW